VARRCDAKADARNEMSTSRIAGEASRAERIAASWAGLVLTEIRRQRRPTRGAPATGVCLHRPRSRRYLEERTRSQRLLNSPSGSWKRHAQNTYFKSVQ
jgi:hypothetical protein